MNNSCGSASPVESKPTCTVIGLSNRINDKVVSTSDGLSSIINRFEQAITGNGLPESLLGKEVEVVEPSLLSCMVSTDQALDECETLLYRLNEILSNSIGIK